MTFVKHVRKPVALVKKLVGVWGGKGYTVLKVPLSITSDMKIQSLFNAQKYLEK